MSVGRPTIQYKYNINNTIQIILGAEAAPGGGMEVRDDGKCLIRSFILVKSFYFMHGGTHGTPPLASAGRAPLVLSP